MITTAVKTRTTTKTITLVGLAVGAVALAVIGGRSMINKPVATSRTSPSSCGFYNQTVFSDPVGDTTPGAPAYVDIKGLTVRQLGDQVQFVWEGSGPLENNDYQFYFIRLDTDFDYTTGQRWGPVGAEIKIGVAHEATINYFQGAGSNEPFRVISDLPVVFDQNKFYLTVPRSYIDSNNFNLHFETSGEPPYADDGSVHEITLQPSQQPVELVISADRMVSLNNPALVTVEQGERRQLRSQVVSGGSRTIIPTNRITYHTSHPVHDERIGDISEIITLQSDGVVRSGQRPGFVFVTGLMRECGLAAAKPLIVAAGTPYRVTTTSDVIATFPQKYATRESGQYTFGQMISDYPNAMKTWELAYDLTSKMYGGFKPFGGAKQILGLIVSIIEQQPNGAFAGGNMNPLQSDPTTYMQADGSPEYATPIHEMGHNFGQSKGMTQLLFSNNTRMNRGGECVASLPVIYLYKDFTDHPERYGINRSSYEYRYFSNKLAADIPTIMPSLNDFESKINSGQISGYFDDSGGFDPVQVFCDFFQTYAYDLTEAANPHHQEVIPRFLRIFSDRDLPNFIDQKSETYFAAAYSVAVGSDMRDKLRFWGFTIDDAYYEQLLPVIERLFQ